MRRFRLALLTTTLVLVAASAVTAQAASSAPRPSSPVSAILASRTNPSRPSHRTTTTTTAPTTSTTAAPPTTTAPTTTTTAAGGSATKHFTVNIPDLSVATADGFDVVDVAGSTSNPAGVKTRVDALPSGVQALIWVGNLDNTNCTTPGFTMAQFQAQVDALAGDPKVFGYYVSDEPHPAICPTAVTDIAARADYIHARAPGQKAFIIVVDGSTQCGTDVGCEYRALQPANSHVDLVGLDPYPCHYTSGTAVPCDLNALTTKVRTAMAEGIPASAIVPVYQTFGQEGRLDGKAVYYRTPSATELASMLATWAQLVPNPVMDYAYTFGAQCTTSVCSSPQALENHPELRAVMAAHNG